MTLSELIAQLQEIADQHEDIDPEVKIAHQPNWPLEFSISGVLAFNTKLEAITELKEILEDPELEADEREHLTSELAALEAEPEMMVFLSEGFSGNGYLTSGVSAELGWK